MFRHCRAIIYYSTDSFHTVIQIIDTNIFGAVSSSSTKSSLSTDFSKNSCMDSPNSLYARDFWDLVETPPRISSRYPNIRPLAAEANEIVANRVIYEHCVPSSGKNPANWGTHRSSFLMLRLSPTLSRQPVVLTCLMANIIVLTPIDPRPSVIEL